MTSTTGTPLARAARGIGTTGLRTSGGYTQPTPYSLQASCELSDDYFLTSDVLIGTNDRVIPFVNPYSKAAEAIVFAGGNLCHLSRNPAASAGWSYEQVDLQGNLASVTDVAVAANGTDVYLLVFGDPGINSDGAPAWLTNLTGADSWGAGYNATADDLGVDPTTETLGAIKGGISPEGMCYFYTTCVSGTTTQIVGWAATGNWNYQPLIYQLYMTLDTSHHSVEDTIILLDTGPNPVGYALVLTSDQTMSVYPEIAYVNENTQQFSAAPLTNAGAEGVTVLMWAWATPHSTTGTPGYAIQLSGTAATGTYFVDENGNDTSVSDQSSVGSNAVTVWSNNGLWTVNLLDQNGTLNVVQEISSGGSTTWYAPVPLTKGATGLAAIFGVPTDPGESTLFAVGLDETLSVLTLDASGWTQTQVHQDGASLQEIDSYRVQATVLDANGAGVLDGRLKISTDRPAGFWQPGGNAAITPVSPVTMNTDGKGEVTFSVPAEELDCAVLTLQALDASGNATGSPFVVTPDTDVRGFLNGAGTLTDIGTISSSTVLSAQNSQGKPLFPALTSLPGDQQQAASSTTVKALSQIVSAGTMAGPSPSNPAQSMKLDLSGSAPSFTTSTDPQAYGQLMSGAELTFSFSHLFDTIGHALRHGAAELHTVVVSWDNDAKNWAVSLWAKVAGAVQQFVNIAINDMKDAFHVIGGFFQALGADIEEAISWLKHNLLELLKEAGANASVIEGWLAQASTQFETVVSGIDVSANKFFSSKETQAHELIGQCEGWVEDLTFGTHGPLPQPGTGSGSTQDQDELSSDITKIAKVINDVPGKWLLDKLMRYLPADDPGPAPVASFGPVINDLATDFVDAIAVGNDLEQLIVSTGKDMFAAGQDKFTQTEMTAWFEAVDKFVHDSLVLADSVANTVLDLVKLAIQELGATLGYEYQLVGSGSILGLILDEAGVSTSMSLSHLISLIVAFPATLIAKIRGLDSLFPPTDSLGEQAAGERAAGVRADDAQPDWNTGLGISAAVIQAIWGLNDIVVDLGDLDDDNGGYDVPAICAWIDILAPVALTVLQWPSEPFSDGSTAYPFHGGLTPGKYEPMLPFIIVSGLVPAMFDLVVKLKTKGSGTNEPAPQGTEDPMADYYSPIVQSVAGLINTVLGTVYNAEIDAGAASITAGILGNVSYQFALLGTAWVAASSEDVSVAVKTIVDAAGNLGAAVAIAEATALPPK